MLSSTWICTVSVPQTASSHLSLELQRGQQGASQPGSSPRAHTVKMQFNCMCRAYGYVCVCVKMTGLYTVDETRTRGDARPVAVFLSRANQTCQSIKRRCHGNDVNTREGHKMECVFPPCWAAVMSGTQLKPRTHTHTRSVCINNKLPAAILFYHRLFFMVEAKQAGCCCTKEDRWEQWFR